ncbi:hypothetical protein RFI_32933 [Reticulomyxa filosa]|uniref:Uncharacterized protein n=1 Tax=Reticulomyxa filosa TaxID=46433 RepID=X6LS63_RETFI|nr:hypothetical protein RFI_32933 [Reticulomyxa filosa]|eukprot:ETO04464.1 hypothetical protein RFI_32933 [Reticulomyxa filosa]
MRCLIDWKALFEWLLIVREKKLGTGAMISFGTYLLNTQLFANERDPIGMASDPTQELRLRKYATQVLKKYIIHQHFHHCIWSCTHWTLVHALFYRYRIGINISYQTVRDKLEEKIDDDVAENEETKGEEDTIVVVDTKDYNVNQIGDITKYPLETW